MSRALVVNSTGKGNSSVATPKETLWVLDPHTKAKHDILRRYLQAWFPILNKHNDRIVYIDGFCGPGRYKGGEKGSPIIALEVATTHRKTMKGGLVFLFIDERQDRIDHLRQVLTTISLPPHFKVSVECGKFHEKIGRVLNSLAKDSASLAPTFAFVDPFGFSGIPFSIIKKLLEQQRCEVFITFMVNAINRFLKHPDEMIDQHIVDAFGTREFIEIAKKTGDRVELLRALYQRQLESTAEFVRYFEMRDRNNRKQYYLFFATNHELGHLKMKEAMWRIDPDGEFKFSDATNPNQMVLFETDTTSNLADLLRKQFVGKGQVTGSDVLKYVENNTAYLGKHMRAALKGEEAAKQILVEPFKTDGTKRRANSYPDGAKMTFV